MRPAIEVAAPENRHRIRVVKKVGPAAEHLSYLLGTVARIPVGKYQDILVEIAQVRKELGYPPLVTPTSQVVGVQAVMNVLHGRYKVITKETKDYCKGMYGKPPAEIDPAQFPPPTFPLDCSSHVKILGEETPGRRNHVGRHERAP